jgi:hypothetical protein
MEGEIGSMYVRRFCFSRHFGGFTSPVRGDGGAKSRHSNAVNIENADELAFFYGEE